MSVRRGSRRFVIFVILTLAVIGLLASSCRSVASPQGWASPVLDDGLLLASHRDDLIALAADDLSELWAFPSMEGDEEIDPVALYGTPAVTADAVFVPTHDGTLYALDRETGRVLWSEETDGPLIGGVAASGAGDTVYFGSSDGKVYALDAANGEWRWDPFETGDQVWSTPTLSGGILYVTSLDGRLYALDVATGEERWSFKTDAGVASTAVVDDALGLVLVGGFDGRLRAIDSDSHVERWSLKAGNWFWTSPLVSGGVVYAGNLDGKVYAVDADTGDARWSPLSTKGPVRSAPVIAGGTLVVVDKGGNVYGLDPATGDSVSNSPLALESDVLTDPLVMRGSSGGGDEVVVVTTDGELVRIDPVTLRVVEGRKLGN